MKKNLLLVCAIATMLVMSSGCKKIIDEIIKNPNGVASDCRVEKLYYDFYTEDWDGNSVFIKDTITVPYDRKGNPLAVSHSTVDGFFQEPHPGRDINKYFLYYPDGRLAVYLEEASIYQRNGETIYSALYWHTYTYEGATVKELSFLYASGKLEIGVTPVHTEHRTFKLELDSYGRIVKDHYYTAEEGIVGSIFYEYDEKGNLAKTTGSDGTTIGTPVVYDLTKYNIKQTHRTWMFISRNFSVNAPLNAAPSYNSNKLPTALTTADPVFGLAKSIRYKCR